MISYVISQSNISEARTSPVEYKNVFRFINQDEDSTCSLEMTTIQCQPESGCVVINSAIGNPVPLFWGWNGDDLIISDSSMNVMKSLNARQDVSIHDIDKVGFFESILFDGPLGERTFFENVKKVQCAETVQINLEEKSVKKHWRWLPKIQINSDMRPEEAYAQAKLQISRLMDHVEIPQDGVLLPITGGLDSRVLAALVRRKSSAPIHSYTFQRGWSFESWCAKKVAKELSAKHTIFNLDKNCYKDFSKKSARNSGGFISGMHTHGIYCCDELLHTSLKNVPRMFGYLGEHVTGAMTDELADGARLSTPEAIFERYSNCMFPDLVERYRSEIINDLADTYAAFKLSGSPEHCFHEFWRIQQRQNNLITHLFHYHRSHHAVAVIEPFINSEFIDFFLALPFTQRFNRTLFKQASKDLFPKVFSLPSMHYGEDSMYAKIEMLCKKMESVADRINIRQEVFLNPFNYEQHGKNLQNYLSDDINNGLNLICQLYQIPEREVEYPMWKQRSTAKEHYRLAMLYQLVDRANNTIE